MTPDEYREMYKTWLKNAMESYNDLMTGGSVRVVVDQNGERVEYTAANRQSLWAYIVRLQGAISAADPFTAYMGKPLGPARFLF